MTFNEFAKQVYSIFPYQTDTDVADLLMKASISYYKKHSTPLKLCKIYEVTFQEIGDYYNVYISLIDGADIVFKISNWTTAF
ncbi:MAG: hypothetical protein K5762_07465 [Bacilli bacterium]|nr:hypothetical protein [Bacilli bacterium]